MAQREPREPTRITGEEFQRDPKGAVARAVRDGRVVITDDEGQPVAAISSPMDRRPVSFD